MVVFTRANACGLKLTSTTALTFPVALLWNSRWSKLNASFSSIPSRKASGAVVTRCCIEPALAVRADRYLFSSVKDAMVANSSSWSLVLISWCRLSTACWRSSNVSLTFARMALYCSLIWLTWNGIIMLKTLWFLTSHEVWLRKV